MGMANDLLNESPMILAQRKRISELFGAPVQRVPGFSNLSRAADVIVQRMGCFGGNCPQKERARKLRKLYKNQDSKSDEMAGVLWETSNQSTKNAYKKDTFGKELNFCSFTAGVISEHLVGRDLNNDIASAHNVAGYIPAERAEQVNDYGVATGTATLLNSSKDGMHNDFRTMLKRSKDGIFYISITGGLSHHFTIVKIYKKYDLYEADANPGAGKERYLFDKDCPTENKSESGTSLDMDALSAKLVAIIKRPYMVATCEYAFKPFGGED